MGRALRAAAGGMVYHVLNRANGRLPLFEKDGDYLVQGTDSDNPFVGCAKAREAAASARSCERQCSQATSDCIAEIGSNAGRSSACFDFAAACMSRCKGE